jgi:hypothetical protein
MMTPHPLDILFLTNFSDSCFRSIPAVAQMADALKVRLTLMHTYNPEKCSQAEADAKVRSFFPEADRYAACQRVSVPGSLRDAVQRHLDVWPVNLIVAPASDPIGFPRLHSLRARLVQLCGVPMWTIGRRIDVPKLLNPVRNVACWLDFHSPQTNHLAYAAEYANKAGAQLHLLRALPPITEGSLAPVAHQNRALTPDLAIDEIVRLCEGSAVRPQVRVATGDGRRTLSRMLRDCDADMVFLPNEESFLAKWLSLSLRVADHIPCAAVYVPERPTVPVWNLERGPASTISIGAAVSVGVRRPAALAAAAGADGGTKVLVAKSRNSRGGDERHLRD